jgi:ABC-type sulfate/molybdate transport systems ATPase subunit
MIGCEAVVVAAGDFALGPLHLRVEDGEYVALVGRSGAGKSVLLETIAGLRRVGAGRVLVGGREVTSLAPERRAVGLVGQESLLFPHLDVEGNIAFGPDVQGHGLRRFVPTKRRSRHDTSMKELAASLGIAGLLTRKPKTLSGGERQRVALARALAVRPHALLLDEPLSALDQAAREELQDELRSVNQRFGLSVLHVTHSLDEAAAVAPRCAVLVDGVIAQSGSLEDILDRPASAAVALLTGARNVLGGEARADGDGSRVTLEDGTVLHTAGKARGQVTVVVRSERVVVKERSSAGRTDTNRLDARVVGVRPTSAGCLVTLDAGGLVAFVPRVDASGHFAVGMPVALEIPVTAVHLIGEAS